MRAVAEPFIRRRAIRHLEKGRVVVFAAGTGNPVLHHRHRRGAARDGDQGRGDPQGAPRSTASTPPIRSSTRTPTRYERISYLQVLQQRLQVMDATAISLCMDNKLPIVVFNLKTPGNIRRVVMGEPSAPR